MRRSTLFALALTLIIVFGGAAAGLGLDPAAAQDRDIRVIPVVGDMFFTRLSPDGHTLAIAEDAQLTVIQDHIDERFLPIRLIDLDSGEERLLTGQTDYATDIAFSPDGATLASYHAGGTLSLWDVASGEERARLPVIPGRTRMVYFPDGQRIATLSGPQEITVWDTAQGIIPYIITPRYDTYLEIKEAQASVPPESFVVFTVMPGGDALAIATGYDNVLLWPLEARDPRVLVASGDERPNFNIRFLTVTADGSQIIYLDTDRADGTMIRFLDVTSGDEVRGVPANTLAAPAVAPDGDRLAWIDDDSGDLVLWDADAPDDTVTIPLPDAPGRLNQPPFGAVLFTPDGQRAIVTGFRGDETTGNNEIWVVELPHKGV